MCAPATTRQAVQRRPAVRCPAGRSLPGPKLQTSTVDSDRRSRVLFIGNHSGSGTPCGHQKTVVIAYPLAGHGVTSQVGMSRPAGHAVRLWRGGGEMNGSGVGKCAAAHVLDVHPPADVHGEIADAPRPRQATETVGLDLDAGEDPGTPGQEMVPEVMQAFVQQHRLADLACHHGALLEGLAGLLHPCHGRDGVQHLESNRRCPRPVDVPGDLFPCHKGIFDGFNPLDVGCRVMSAQLGRVGTVSFPAGPFDSRHHGRRRAGGNRGVDLDRVGLLAAEESPQRFTRRLADKVPAGHVDGRLGVEVTGETGVHRPVDGIESARVPSQQRGRQHLERGPQSLAVGRKI